METGCDIERDGERERDRHIETQILRGRWLDIGRWKKRLRCRGLERVGGRN